MSVPVPSTPTNPELREQLAEVLQDQLDGDWTTNNTIAFMAYFGERAATAALTVVAPVLEGLRAEVEQWKATYGETALRDATAIIAERDALRAERKALSSLLWGVARRAGQMRRERDFWRGQARQMERNWDAAREANNKLLSRPSVSDQTPARPKGAVRGRGNDPVTVTNNQLTNWAARIARLAWSAEDDTAHGKAIALAMEMKALTDAAPSSVQGDTTPRDDFDAIAAAEYRAASAPSEGDHHA